MVRSLLIMCRNPTVLMGAPRSLMKMYRPGSCSRCNRRSALEFGASQRTHRGQAVLAAGNVETAVSQVDLVPAKGIHALSPCRKASRIMVASRCPWRLSPAAFIRRSTSRSLRYSVVRQLAFGSRPRATVLFWTVGVLATGDVLITYFLVSIFATVTIRGILRTVTMATDQEAPAGRRPTPATARSTPDGRLGTITMGFDARSVSEFREPKCLERRPQAV